MKALLLRTILLATATTAATTEAAQPTAFSAARPMVARTVPSAPDRTLSEALSRNGVRGTPPAVLDLRCILTPETSRTTCRFRQILHPMTVEFGGADAEIVYNTLHAAGVPATEDLRGTRFVISVEQLRCDTRNGCSMQRPLVSPQPVRTPDLISCVQFAGTTFTTLRLFRSRSATGYGYILSRSVRGMEATLGEGDLAREMNPFDSDFTFTGTGTRIEPANPRGSIEEDGLLYAGRFSQRFEPGECRVRLDASL